MSKILEVKNCEYSEHVLETILLNIKLNKIVIMPSDTVYGFLTNLSQEQKLRDIKRRDKKPFLMLISKIEQLEKIGIDTAKYAYLFEKYWPGPITFIVENNNNKTIGVRMPDIAILKYVLDETGVPLLSTSVNYSGKPQINDIDQIINEFRDKADLIIADRCFRADTASTIVDITKKPYKILRKGRMNFYEN